MKTEKHYAIRYRSNDGIHQKGDIQFVNRDVLYIGQTPECLLQLPMHPLYADKCYAVIVKDHDTDTWHIIRQERDAKILINGTPLELIAELDGNCNITFDDTNVLFTIEDGDAPRATYVQHRSQKALWCAVVAIAAVLLAIILRPQEEEKNLFDAYTNEISCVYKIEADTMFALTIQGDTLETIALPQGEIGTGFVTDKGYFVTARHCIEFWLGYEDKLKTSFDSIESKPVVCAIRAEMEDTIRLVTKLTITDDKGMKYNFTSDQFTTDKSRDNVYEMGKRDNSYLWRSVISRYEDCDAELGDVAVMKWPHGKGRIELAPSERILNVPRESMLQSFGYPQSQSKQKAVLTADNGKLRFIPDDKDEPIICHSEFESGFSGAPVFVSDKDYSNKTVVGIVSRIAGKQTLVVPVSQIHNLINTIENNGKEEQQ